MRSSFRFSKCLLTLSLSSLLSTATAFPLIPPLQAAHNLQPRASYSVVAVDGGSSTAAPTPTATVTDLITHTQTILTTQLSTVVITQGASPTTIVVTVTSALATTIVETPPAPVPTMTDASPVTVTVTNTDTSVTTIAPDTRPFDDGLWHTTYYYTVSTPAAESSSAPASTPAGAPPYPMPSASEDQDDGSWGRWDGVTGGWQGPPKP